MKKFAFNAVALAAGALAAGGALAGTITIPATDAAATKYAAEGIATNTAVVVPTFQYTMGVGRPVGNGFTILVTPSSGSAFSGLAAGCPLPTSNSASTLGITLKRFSSTECAYDVQVATLPVSAGDVFNFANFTFASTPMSAAGGSSALSINLKDPGETSQVDNSGPITRVVGTSVNAINIYAASSDTATVADVAATGGPLTGFVANGTVPADTANTAAANLVFDHNSALAKAADGVATYAFAGTVSLTLTGTTSGAAAANGICIDLDADAVRCETGELFNAAAGSASLTNVVSGFPAAGTTANRTVTFLADGTTPLGTSRTFSVSGTVTPTLANTSAHALFDTATSKNSTWWVWSANASQLVSPYFTTDSRFLSRFVFLNTNSSPVSWTAKCYGETGTVIAASAGGNLTAAGTTVVPASQVCGVTGATRASVVFTINTPISSVKGMYQAVDPVSLGAQVAPLVRPYGNNTTE